MTRYALQGVRILDLTQVAAGPYATFLLGFLGAEVIKIESCGRPDISRGPVQPRPHQYHQYPDGDPGDQPWNRMAYHAQRNRNKLSLTLDVTTPEGKALFLRLAGVCDALVENYRASVMDRWGLGYERLKAECSHLVYLKLSSQGNTGPERDYGSLGLTLECTAGLAAQTGYLDGVPRMTNEVYPDPVVGTLAVGALLAGLRYRRRTDEGVFIDLSQREVTSCLIGDSVLDFSFNHRIAEPNGNRHREQAPQGVYPCRGDDAWVALTVRDDAEWQVFRRAIGDPDWAHHYRYADTLGRLLNHETVDAGVAAWTQERTPDEVMEILQSHGIPAGAVRKGSEVIRDPHLAARNYWDYRSVDSHEFAYTAPPWTLAASPRAPGNSAPDLGAHNEYVLGDLLGLTAAEIEALKNQGVIGTTPTQTDFPL